MVAIRIFYEAAMMADINRTSLHAGLLFAGVFVGAFLADAVRVVGMAVLSVELTQALLAGSAALARGRSRHTGARRGRRLEFGQIAEAYNDMAAAICAARQGSARARRCPGGALLVAESHAGICLSHTNNRLQVEIAERQNTGGGAGAVTEVLQAALVSSPEALRMTSTICWRPYRAVSICCLQTVLPEEKRKHTWIERGHRNCGTARFAI